LREDLPTYVKYPFLIDVKEYFSHFYSYPVDLNDLIDIPDYYEGALRRVELAITNRPYRPSLDEGREVAVFHLALVIAALADIWALRKLADYEGKRANEYLRSEKDEVIQAVGRRLGVKMELLATDTNRCGFEAVVGEDPRSGRTVIECYPFRMPIPVYLKLSEKLRTDPKWKLTNLVLRKGYVYLGRREVVRLLEEAVKAYINEMRLYVEEITNEKFVEAAQNIRELVRKVRGFTTQESEKFKEELMGEIREDVFPPCIKEILSTLLRGEHLTHHQRFAAATFLVNIGASVDYILDLMRHSPDFNERIARYQIEHLAGLRGSRKKYMTYSCEKMKTLGMCVADCGTKTPLQYYWRELRKERRKSSQPQKS